VIAPAWPLTDQPKLLLDDEHDAAVQRLRMSWSCQRFTLRCVRSAISIHRASSPPPHVIQPTGHEPCGRGAATLDDHLRRRLLAVTEDVCSTSVPTGSPT